MLNPQQSEDLGLGFETLLVSGSYDNSIRVPLIVFFDHSGKTNHSLGILCVLFMGLRADMELCNW